MEWLDLGIGMFGFKFPHNYEIVIQSFSRTVHILCWAVNHACGICLQARFGKTECAEICFLYLFGP